MTDTSDDTEMSLALDLGILIYSQHKNLKTITIAEQQQALRVLPPHIQLEIQDKLVDVGRPVAGIYFHNDSHSQSTDISTINLAGMLNLQKKATL